MISALWLLLIVPASAILGYSLACFMWTASERKNNNEKNS